MVFRKKSMSKKSSVKKPIFKKPSAKKLQVATQRRNLVSLIKSVNLKQTETKYISKSQTFTSTVHNAINVVRLWGDNSNLANNVMPNQGDTDANRSGDSIVATGYKIRYNIVANSISKQGHYKFFFLPYNSDQGDPTDRAQLTHTLTDYLSLDPIQSKRWKGIKYLGKRYMRSTDSSSNEQGIINGSFWIPLKRTINFKNDTTNITTNLKENGILIWYYTGNLALADPDSATTYVAEANFCSTLYFKDP